MNVASLDDLIERGAGRLRLLESAKRFAAAALEAARKRKGGDARFR